jgi:integrase
MTDQAKTPTDGDGGGSNKRKNLSLDGVWRTYPNVPNLLCYVKSGMFYGRLKVRGKQIRRSLETAVFSTAKLRLADLIRGARTTKPVSGTFQEARAAYEADLTAAHEVGENSKRYRRYCVKKLLATWPELDTTALEKITASDCKAWAARFLASGADEVYFNNTLGTLRAILKRGGLADNPAAEVKRMGVKRTVLALPEPAKFSAILDIIRAAGAPQSGDCADFVRFLAFSGCRISEARQVKWADVDFERGIIKVRNSKSRLSQDGDELRQVPIIADMAALLAELKKQGRLPGDNVCKVGECEKSLTRACKLANIPRITHHDLRHLFATRCIESGVDIPTVSRWLGHKDGGALAMRVYGHLRDHHSTEMAKKVTFGTAKAPGESQPPREPGA